MTNVQHTTDNTEAVIIEWREQLKNDPTTTWPIMPTWVESLDIDTSDDEHIRVTLKGHTWTAGPFESRIEQTFLVYTRPEEVGDNYYTPAEPLVVMPYPMQFDHGAEQALQIAAVITSAATELSMFEEKQK